MLLGEGGWNARRAGRRDMRDVRGWLLLGLCA